MQKAIARLIEINRSLIESMRNGGLISVSGAQSLLRELADAARHIEKTAMSSASRAVSDVRRAVQKERKQLGARVKAVIGGRSAPARRPAAAAKKKPAAKKRAVAAPKKKPAAKKRIARKPAARKATGRKKSRA